MKQWVVLYKKELLEMTHSYKWLWVPLVFILLGIMQPLSTYYMPQILDMAGGLPEGAVIQLPQPSAAEVMIKTLSQFGMIGVLILVLAFMNSVAGERQSGTVSLIMVKPVSHAAYLGAKLTGMLSLTVLSFFLGDVSSWYYTNSLFGSISFSSFIQSFAVYSLWLAFIVTVTLVVGTMLQASAAIAFVSILAIVGLTLSTNLFTKAMSWSPAKLSEQAAHFLLKGSAAPHFGLNLCTTSLLMFIMYGIAVVVFKSKELH